MCFSPPKNKICEREKKRADNRELEKERQTAVSDRPHQQLKERKKAGRDGGERERPCRGVVLPLPVRHRFFKGTAEISDFLTLIEGAAPIQYTSAGYV